MGGGPSTPSSTTQQSTTTQQPWGQAKPYLLGDEGKSLPGVFPEAASYYQQYGQLTPQQSSANQAYQDILINRYKNMAADPTAKRFLSGQFDPYGQTTARQSDPRRYWAAMGDVDPTAAMANQLSGDPTNNPYLAAMNQANINQALQGYGDAINQLQTSVLPQIGREAFASGGYGGSRQGVAEGLALQQMQRNARDLGQSAMDYGSRLYGQAFESAQGRQADMASLLSQMGVDVSQFNAGQLQNTDQFNRQLQMQQLAQSAQNAAQGTDIQNQKYAMMDNTYNQLQSLYGAPQAQQQNALNQYANIISPGAALGGSSSGSQTIPLYEQSGTQQLLGGATSIAGLLASLQ